MYQKIHPKFIYNKHIPRLYCLTKILKTLKSGAWNTVDDLKLKNGKRKPKKNTGKDQMLKQSQNNTRKNIVKKTDLNLTNVLKKTMMLSMCFAVSATVSGIFISYQFDIAQSGCIVLVAAAIFVGSLVAKGSGMVKTTGILSNRA